MSIQNFKQYASKNSSKIMRKQISKKNISKYKKISSDKLNKREKASTAKNKIFKERSRSFKIIWQAVMNSFFNL